MPSLSYKQLNLLATLVCAFLIAGAYYFEIVLGLAPCPLCILQRYAIIIIGVLFLLTSTFSIKHLKTQITLNSLNIIFCVLGLVLALRQSYLERFVPAGEVPSCLPSIEYMITHFPLSEIIVSLFEGTTSCAQSSWSFLGLSMAEILSVFLVMFMVFCIANLRKLIKKSI